MDRVGEIPRSRKRYQCGGGGLQLTMKYLLIILGKTFAHEPCHSEGVSIT